MPPHGIILASVNYFLINVAIFNPHTKKDVSVAERENHIVFAMKTTALLWLDVMAGLNRQMGFFLISKKNPTE